MKNTRELAAKVNWILLGLVLLIPGILKLFIIKPAAITEMLAGYTLFGSIPLFSYAPALWAWILILSEIVVGALILIRWKPQYTMIPAMIIFVSVSLGPYWGEWPNAIAYILIASNYWFWGTSQK